MEIYPAQQLLLLTVSLLRGMALGLFFEALTALRILLGAYRPPAKMRQRYAKKLPILGREVPFDRSGAVARPWRVLITALLDLLFCLTFTVTVLLTLYGYGDGSLRLFAIVLALVGFGALHAAAATVLSPLMAYFAYGLAAGVLYLKALFKLPLRPIRALPGRLRRRRLRRISDALCAAQLVWAEQGILFETTKLKPKGSVCDVQKDARQDLPPPMGDPHPHSHHLRGGHRHHGPQHHGGKPQPAGGRAGKRRADRAERRRIEL